MSSLHLAAGSECPPVVAGLLRCYSMKYCPFAQRTRLVLAAKKVEHEIVNINLKSKPEWYFKKNPLGKVPALEKNGSMLYESLITCDYLDEAYPSPPLYPADPWSKAQDRVFMELWSKVYVPVIRCYYANGDQAVIKQSVADIETGLDLFEVELTKRNTKFFGGGSPGMLDYMMWPWAERLPLVKVLAENEAAISQERFPKMCAWMSCMREDPAVLDSLVSTNTHIKFVRDRPDGLPQYDMEEVP